MAASLLGIPNSNALRRLLTSYISKRNPLGLKEKRRSQYDSEKITKKIVAASLATSRSIHDASAINETPTGRTVLNWLYDQEPEEIINSVNNYLEKMYGAYIRQELRGHKIVFLNIDTHLEPYWGEPVDWIIKGLKQKEATKHMKLEFFAIQLSNFKAVLHVRKFHRVGYRKKPKREEVLNWANGYVHALRRIKEAYIPGNTGLCAVFDGEYFDAYLLDALDKASFYFIVRAGLGSQGIRLLVQKYRLDRLLKDSFLEFDYTIKSKRFWPHLEVNVRLIFGWRGCGLVALVTNLPKSFGSKAIFEIYARRFWIENDFRDGRLFRLRTCSRRFVIRLAFFLIGIIVLDFFLFIRAIFGLSLPFRVLSLFVLIDLVLVEKANKWT